MTSKPVALILASPGLVGRIDAWCAAGYEVRLVFVSLPKTDTVASDEDRLARHLEWQRAMQEAVACALDEHRAKGRSIAVLREGKVVTLAPSQY